MKKIFRFLFSRLFIIALLIAIQAAFLVTAILKLYSHFVYIYFISLAVGLIVVVALVSKPINPSFKIRWIILILTFPVIGAPLYFLFNSNEMSKKYIRVMTPIIEKSKPYLKQDERILQELGNDDAICISKLLYKTSGFPTYKNSLVEYLPTGEQMFTKMLEEISKAKDFIYMEYFIIEEGKMWNTILELLAKKVQEGVDVRFMFDDMGCINKIPFGYENKMRERGIKTVVFNRFRARLTIEANNRDHRKITVIDGKVAFTGGINLADEYINEISRFGYWKDSGIIIKGESVKSFTIMFLQMWEYHTGEVIDFKEHIKTEHPEHMECKGVTAPFGDAPFDGDIIAELAYISMLNRADKYAYITTPYLIIDNELVTALTLAAKSGVDVRLICPYIADGFFVGITTRSYYKELLKCGVRIYEYTPGFIHSKTFVSDDTTAIVGTINLDYRSLYHHYECGVWTYMTPAVMQVKEDFIKTLEVSKEYSLEDYNDAKWYEKILRPILRLFSTLL